MGVTPSSRCAHTLTGVGERHERLYVFGGWNGKEMLADVHVLNTGASARVSCLFHLLLFVCFCLHICSRFWCAFICFYLHYCFFDLPAVSSVAFVARLLSTQSLSPRLAISSAAHFVVVLPSRPTHGACAPVSLQTQ